MMEFKPHEFQEENVRWLLERHAQRQLRSLILDEMGLGKSVSAILCAKALSLQRVLVVTKGLVRPAWKERFNEWWPERAHEVSTITEGRLRKGRSKPAEGRIAAAYAQPIQIVTPDLLGEIEQVGWNMLVWDEIHEHVSYRSATSKQMRGMLGANPLAISLGLTGTFVPAEPLGAWNMLHTFWPAEWGRPTASGEPPFKFKERYCDWEPSEYSDSGKRFFGLNEHNRDELAARIMLNARRTRRQDVAHLLPALDVSPLTIDCKDKRTDAQIAVDWADTASKESTHVQIFTYRRETAETISGMLQKLPRYRGVDVAFTHGADSPEKRDQLLRRLRLSPRACLVGTMDSLGTGISLTDFQQYLICEVTSTANQLAQAIARFSRLDKREGVPSKGYVLLREGKHDDLVETLKRRLDDTDSLIKNGQTEAVLRILLGTATSNNMDSMLDDLVANYRGDVDENEE